MDKGILSILIPACNHERCIEGCVRFVLAQDWRNIELLVVDDGSEDSTWAKLQAMRGECERKLARVEMATQENHGTALCEGRTLDSNWRNLVTYRCHYPHKE